MHRRQELAAFLRSRRERLGPGDVGLPSSGRRRTPGLRREEVALLAGISATWYTYLEQGRNVQPSDQVISALADTLRLDRHEREHLLRLAGYRPGGVSGSAQLDSQAQFDSPAQFDGVARLDAPPLDAPAAAVPFLLGDNPAYIIGPGYDLLSHNPATEKLFPGVTNLARWVFLDPGARETMVDWEPDARGLLARLRNQVTRQPSLGVLIDELREGSPEVRAWWPRQEVQAQHSGRKRLRDATGRITVFDYTAFHLADQPDQVLVVYAATP